MTAVRLASLIAAVAEVVLPSLCVSCQDVLSGDDGGLCCGCWSRVIPAAGQRCPRCGGPGDDPEAPCLACHDSPPPQQGTVIWGEHEGVLRTAVLALKHHGHDELAAPLAARLAAKVALADWANEIEVVTAVPSHPVHRLRRGFSAAELLATTVALERRLPALALLARRGLARQTGRSRAQRLALPERTFRARADLGGARVLVVDDVTTTGATLRRAAHALLGAGADVVFCAAVASAPEGRRSP
jgi:predicted amidophosphoribosyltransferase